MKKSSSGLVSRLLVLWFFDQSHNTLHYRCDSDGKNEFQSQLNDSSHVKAPFKNRDPPDSFYRFPLGGGGGGGTTYAVPNNPRVDAREPVILAIKASYWD